MATVKAWGVPPGVPPAAEGVPPGVPPAAEGVPPGVPPLNGNDGVPTVDGM